MLVLPAPFVLVLWLIDILLIACCVRFLLAQLNTDWARQVFRKLARFTDAIPDAIGYAIAQQGKRQVPTWLLWLIVIISTVFIRSTLLTFAFHAR